MTPNLRRTLRRTALAVAIVLACPAAPFAVEPAPRAEAVASVAITVADLDRSVAFFRDVLGFVPVSETEAAGEQWEQRSGVFGIRLRIAVLRLGREVVELADVLAPRGRAFPDDTRANDHWFQHLAIVVSDMDAAYARLRAAGVEHASTGPQTLPASIPAAAGLRAFYFRDPDGHFLELIQFPAGKGDARWQSKDALFLGIDHTAIVVADTARALGFYRDSLGLAVAGESRNAGTEQEHLNNVEGARLRITGLRAPGGGPGIELLEYLAPRDGRIAEPLPRFHDLAFWRTQVTTRSAGHAGVLRDPDGHAVEVLPAGSR